MDKSLYDDVVLYLRDGAYRTGNSRSRFLVRQAAHRYSLYGRRLRQGSLIVLHEGEAFDVLMSFHRKKKHIRGPEFYAAVRREYAVSPLQPLCQDVVRNCEECTGTYTHYRNTGPMQHLSIIQRKNACKKIGIPFVRDIGLHGAPDIDPSKFAPISIDMAGPRNCFCIVMSYVFSGTCENTAAIEEWVKKIRRGPHSSLYSTFGAEAPESLDDVSYLTQTDVKIIARELGVNFYEYFPATSNRSARWEVCSGNKKGPENGGFYFAWTRRDGRGHSLLVRGLKPIST